MDCNMDQRGGGRERLDLRRVCARGVGPRSPERPLPKEDKPTHTAPGEGSALDKPIKATHPKASLNFEVAGVNTRSHLDCPKSTTKILKAEEGGKLAVEGKTANLGNSKQKAPAGTVLQRNAHDKEEEARRRETVRRSTRIAE